MADITPSLRAAGVVTFASAGVCPGGWHWRKSDLTHPNPKIGHGHAGRL
jgi:hypothetical protein